MKVRSTHAQPPAVTAESSAAPEEATHDRDRETERLRRELERLRLAASRDKGLLDAVLEHSPHGIIVCDRQGKLILQNPASERIWAGSASADNVSGWAKYRGFHPDGRPFEPEDWAMAECLRTGRTVEARRVDIQRFDDTPGHLLASSAPLYDARGEISGALSVFADVTRLEQTEAALEQSEHRYQQILDSVQDLVFSKDRNLRVTYANRATCNYYQMSAQELRGITDVAFNQREFTERYSKDDLHVLETGRTVEVLEEPNTHVSGEIRYFHTIKTPVFDRDGQVIEIVGVSREITERRRTERRLAAHHAVARIVAESSSVAEAMPEILAAIGEGLEWHWGAFWSLDSSSDALRCTDVWVARDVAAPSFEAASRAWHVERGAGLPGRAWETARPQWIADCTTDSDFPRRAAAVEDGLRGAFAFPVGIAGEAHGVFEFLHREVLVPDEPLLQMVATLGSQIGQFLTRTRAQQAVQESEAVKAAVLESALDGVVTIDETGAIREFNAAAERMFLLGRGDAIGRTLADLIVPERYRAAHSEGLARHLATGETRLLGNRVEIAALRADGTEFPVELAITPIRIGRQRLFTAFIRDISERQREAAQREFMVAAGDLFSSSLQYETILSRLVHLAVPRLADWCALALRDEHGQVRYTEIHHADPNKLAFARELHQRHPPDPESPRGTPAVLRTGQTEWAAALDDARLAAAAQDDEHLALLRSLGLKSYMIVPLAARGRVLAALTLVCAESGRHFTEADVRFVQDLARRAALSVDNAMLYREATRKAEALREETRALESLNRIGNTLAAELDLQKLVQAVTDTTTALSGAKFGAFFYNATGPNGQAYLLYTISGAPREAFARFPTPRNTALFGPTFAGEGVVRLDDVTKDPRYGRSAPHHGMPEGHLPVRSYLAIPVISRSGRVIGGLFFGHPEPGVFTERSERLIQGVAAQAAIAIDNAHLFEQAQRLIGALERSNAELDQFAYVASHDLKAPLRGIANLSQWMEEDLEDRITAEGREQMRLLRGRVNRLEALIEGILSYSRAGRTREPAQPVDVDALAREVIELLAPEPPARAEIEAQLPTIEAERVPLQQVLLNLVSNALKHAGRPDPHVKIAAREHDAEWEFAVTDDGQGIAREYHDKIWGIFQTLEPRDRVEGTGIGLSVVKKIIESRGGRIWLDSEPGQGATFHFTWPKRTEREAS